MSELPKQVAEAEKRADELLKNLSKPKSEEELPENKEDNLEPPEDNQPEEGVTQEEESVDTTDEKDEEVEQPHPSEDKWEAKYKTLKGKYDAEVPRMAKEIRELKSKLEAAMLEIKDLRERAEAKPQEEEPSVEESAYSPDDFEEYGDEFKALAADNIRLKKELEELKKQIQDVTNVTQTTSQHAFIDKLDALFPDWRELNNDEGFNAWLDEVDELSGESRRTFLDKAVSQLDANKVSKFFIKYKQLQEKKSPPKQKVEQQVQPKRNRSDYGAHKEKKVWSREEIAEFYSKLARGDFYGREDLAQKIEHEINLAVQEGRVAV